MEFVKKGDWDGAIDAFLQSVYFARNSYAPASYYMLGCSYEAKNTPQDDLKAIEAGKKFLEQATKDTAKGNLLLAELYIKTGNLDEAEKQCTDSISEAGLTFNGQRGHYLWGRIYEKRKDYDEADDQYQLALGDTPWSYTEAWMAHAELMMHQKDWAGALNQFEGMLRSQKSLKGLDIVRVFRDSGQCLLSKGNHQGALESWHKALDFNQTDAQTHLDLGMMFDSEIHVQSAIDEYKQYVRYSPDQYRVQKVKERILMLEQKVHPAEPTYQAKPSPYIRRQYQQQQTPPAQQEQPVQGLPQPKDSGF
jgi:tetratricopeptide (TPR) repeat protein